MPTVFQNDSTNLPLMACKSCLSHTTSPITFVVMDKRARHVHCGLDLDFSGIDRLFVDVLDVCFWEMGNFWSHGSFCLETIWQRVIKEDNWHPAGPHIYAHRYPCLHAHMHVPRTYTIHQHATCSTYKYTTHKHTQITLILKDIDVSLDLTSICMIDIVSFSSSSTCVLFLCVSNQNLNGFVSLFSLMIFDF